MVCLKIDLHFCYLIENPKVFFLNIRAFENNEYHCNCRWIIPKTKCYYIFKKWGIARICITVCRNGLAINWFKNALAPGIVGLSKGMVFKCW